MSSEEARRVFQDGKGDSGSHAEGTKKLSAVVERLAAVCREHLLREKILVVPSLAIGHQIADAVAHGGTPWVNLRAETIRTLADAIAGFDLAREGITVLSRAQALAIIERACDEVLDAASYFAALKDRPGLHRAIQKSIDDLRHAGVDSAAMPESVFEDPRKAIDLGRILAAYERELIDGRFVDRFGVLSRAIALLEGGAVKPWAGDAVWMVIDELELTGAEEKLLSLASGGRFEKLVFNDHETTPHVDFRRAAGEENELRGAFRAILGAAIPFDDAEIVYTTREPYLALGFELAAEHAVPCTFAEGVSSHYTRPGQAVLGFLRWMGGGWDAVHLQRIARSGVMSLGDDPATLGSRAFARVLRKAAIGWGRDRHLARIDVLIAGRRVELEEEEDAARSDRIERSILEDERARDVITRLLALTEVVAEGEEIDPALAARTAQHFVAAFGAIRNEVDAMASAGLQRMLEELAALPGRKTSRAVVTARLSEAVAQLHVSASNPRPGYLHVTPVRAGGWSARRRMFIVGADDSKHPGRGLQDPIVLDSERNTINQRIDPRQLALLGEAPRRTTEQFDRLIARSGTRVITISFADLDLKERREHFPAPVFLDLYRRQVGQADASYKEVEKAVARQGFVDQRPLSASEWWLMRRFSDHDPNLRPSVLAAYPTLASGAEAEAERASDRLTKWDGLIDAPINDPNAELDPRRNGRIYSASQLEKMASCPYQYFLARILHVEPLDDLTFEPDSWLQGREFGSMLHEVLQQTMDTLCAAGQKPSLTFLPQMEAIAEAALREWRNVIPPPNEAAFERRRTELFRSAELFLRNEEEACRRVTPKFFEVSFGFGEDSPDSIAMPEPLTITLGGNSSIQATPLTRTPRRSVSPSPRVPRGEGGSMGASAVSFEAIQSATPGTSIQLRGRIDRVDHDEATNEWSIWDYKSGGTYEYDHGGLLQRGRKVQHAIYARALEAMLLRKGLTGQVAQSGYFFPTPKGRGARIARVAKPGELEHSFNALFDVIGRGYFLHAEADACRWCDFKELCGGEQVAASRTAAKIAVNPGDAAVTAWVRLQGIR